MARPDGSADVAAAQGAVCFFPTEISIADVHRVAETLPAPVSQRFRGGLDADVARFSNSLTSSPREKI